MFARRAVDRAKLPPLLSCLLPRLEQREYYRGRVFVAPSAPRHRLV